MKSLLLSVILLINISLYAQDYKKNWEKVMEYELDGKIKSAAAETLKIYAQAKKDKNEAQVIKTFFFSSKYLQVLEEDAQVKIINNLRSEIKMATPATKALLQSVYGEVLNDYFSRNRYKINQRTTIDSITSGNFLEWTGKDFEKAIDDNYRSSIINRDLLYSTPLEKYKDVLDFNFLSPETKRSLYDFLLERYVFSPKYNDDVKFYSTEDEAELLYGPTDDFLKFRTDSLPEIYKSRITLFQQVEIYYTLKNDTLSLHRSILRRLKYISYVNKNYSNDRLYINALEGNIKIWNNDNPFLYQAILALAELYKYKANVHSHADNYIKALNLCNEILANIKKTDAGPAAAQLKNSIVNRSVNLYLEGTPLPDRPALSLVNYKNITSLRIDFYKIKEKYANRRLYTDTVIANKKPLITKIYNLPGNKDYFNHSTEIIIPALSSGHYLVVASDVQDNKLFSYQTLQVSQIDLIEQEIDNDVLLQVVNRQSGAPVANAFVILDGKKLRLDSEAKVRVKPVVPKTYNPNAYPRQKSYKNLDIKAIFKNDTVTSVYTNNFGSLYEDDENDYEPEARKMLAQVFLDRDIYRPGQTLYFKGILTLKNKKGMETLPDFFVSVIIKDVNNAELKSFRLKTNEFGSFTGEYTLPKNVLPGNFSIVVNRENYTEKVPFNKISYNKFWRNTDFSAAWQSFKVEEYKRPTFTVSFDPVTQDFRLGEIATLTGIAKSYNGAPIVGGKVKYRVTRNINMTVHGYESDSEGELKEIAQGEAITGPDGKFSIKYRLDADDVTDNEGLPIFSFSTDAGVSDINGETRTANSSLKAGYHSLILEAIVPEVIRAESKNNTISINSKNLNGQFLAVEGTVTIYKVAAPDKVYKERPWEEPEIQKIHEDDFAKYFPSTPYRSIDTDTVIYSKNVFTKNINTSITKSVDLKDFTGWASGAYELVFTAKDSANNTIVVKKSFSLLRNKDNYLPDNKLFKYEIANTDFGGDGFVAINLRTALPELYVNITAEHKDGYYNKYVLIKNGKAQIKLPIDKYTRNVEVHLDYIWENYSNTEYFDIAIPEAVEDLIITATSINNKLLPGGKENWSFTVSGNKKLPSEVLASMYDASMDSFSKSEWYFDNPELDYDYDQRVSSRSLYTRKVNISFSNKPNINFNVKSFEHNLKTFGFNIIQSEFYTVRKPPAADINSPKNELKPDKNGISYINGIVSDEAGPLPGVTVAIKDTEEATQTDFDGYYSIAVRIGDILVFDYIGFESKEVIVSSGIIDVLLKESSLMLQETVIDRYRSPGPTFTTKLSPLYLENRSNSSVLQSLQGQVAGLNISTGSGQPGAYDAIILRGVGTINGDVEPLFIIDGIPVDEAGFRSLNQNNISSFSILKDAAASSIYGNRGKNGVVVITTKKGQEEIKALQQVQVRKNFNETAFFYPQLTTDKKGNLTFSFTTPESLTEWKLRLLAHNKKGVSGYFESIAITQKDLMIVPNMPRFLREKDTIVISAKITNVTADVKNGTAMLQLFDAMTMQPADAVMMNAENIKPFTITAKGSTTVNWKIAVPIGIEAVQYKVVAKAGNFTDGEENVLPVLSNKMLVTESIPLWVRGNSTKEYTFKNLKNNSSATLLNHQITLEYTSNPAWIAIQSLPYLMEYEHECAEQVFARFYANAIATHIVNANPKIAEVFAKWREKGKTISKLNQNEELKSIITAESPWLQDAVSDEERKNRIALLFDLDKMKTSLDDNLRKLSEKQMPSGGFPWFDGGNENEYITRHILAGLGHLKTTGIKIGADEKITAISKKGVLYIDAQFLAHYALWEKENKKAVKIVHPYSELHYLYTRSFYISEYPADSVLKKAIDKYLIQIKDNWLTYSLYEKGMAALALNRFGEKEAALKIIRGLEETAANNIDSGMYWIENKAGCYWHQAPVETQALLIEAFTEITTDTKAVDAMKVWLLKNKQAKNWATTKSTTEAVFALMLKGTEWLSLEGNTLFRTGSEKAMAEKLSENKAEEVTGYVKLNWRPEEITKDLATLTIENNSAIPGYGGFYWQYFEDLDKINTAQENVMNISKELYIKINTANGPELKKISLTNIPTIGNLVTVRLILTIKEDMEFVHLKDLRAAAFEPVDVISKYEWKDGLGFYRSTKDAATHYFFDKINKGTYVLEYDVRVNNAGEFSNGISTIQSMYAPEFSGHSKGIRIKLQ